MALPVPQGVVHAWTHFHASNFNGLGPRIQEVLRSWPASFPSCNHRPRRKGTDRTRNHINCRALLAAPQGFRTAVTLAARSFGSACTHGRRDLIGKGMWRSIHVRECCANPLSITNRNVPLSLAIRSTDRSIKTASRSRLDEGSIADPQGTKNLSGR